MWVNPSHYASIILNAYKDLHVSRSELYAGISALREIANCSPKSFDVLGRSTNVGPVQLDFSVTA